MKPITMNFKGEAAKWDLYDLPTQLQPLLQGGFRVDVESGTIKAHRASGWSTPWIYVKSMDCKRCNVDHNIKFEYYNYIPPRCLQCWKVTVGPRTFAELMKLLEIEQGMDVPCKCGIEVRDYTSKWYGGYFYCASLEEGRERYEQVRKLVDENISKDVPVILKRGCTEFEFALGPSPFWVLPDKMRKTDELIEDYVDHAPNYSSKQTEYQKAHVKKKWIKWAHSHGDMSYLPWNDGEPIVPDYVKFHEGDIKDIKNDLALAEATMLAQQNGVELDTDQLGQFRELMAQYSMNTQIPPKYLTKMGDYFDWTPELTGEMDDTNGG